MSLTKHGHGVVLLLFVFKTLLTTDCFTPFVLLPTLVRQPQRVRCAQGVAWRRHQQWRPLRASTKSTPPPLPNTSDPYVLLQVSTPTTDRNEIKRAYKRMALLYHPDMLITPHSTKEERQKASDGFARINAAYQALTSGRPTSASTKTSSTSTTNGNYQPPHRRTSAPPADTASTNWRDYMPDDKYDDDLYDAGGDSFGAIFSDLFSGIASSSPRRSGVLQDLVEFLEQNVGVFGKEDDELYQLLTSGTLQNVRNEMDDTSLLVAQLETKFTSLTDELVTLEKLMLGNHKYLEKMELDQRMQEVKARKDVLKEYIKKARGRLEKLQGRYKELLIYGGGRRQDGRGRNDSNAAYDTYTKSAQSSFSTENKQTSSDTSWKTESFGSKRGGGNDGSSRRRSRPGASSSNTNDSYSRQQRQQPSTTPDDNTPPHRRFADNNNNNQEDKSRLRQMKVDEEFDKLKRELGL